MSRVIPVLLLSWLLTGDLIGKASGLCAHLQGHSKIKTCACISKQPNSIKPKADNPTICTHPTRVCRNSNVKASSSRCCRSSAPIETPPAETATDFPGGRGELQADSSSGILGTNFFGYSTETTESRESLFALGFNGLGNTLLCSPFRI
jgi:hypothetical protein